MSIPIRVFIERLAIRRDSAKLAPRDSARFATRPTLATKATGIRVERLDPSQGSRPVALRVPHPRPPPRLGSRPLPAGRRAGGSFPTASGSVVGAVRALAPSEPGVRWHPANLAPVRVRLGAFLRLRPRFWPCRWFWCGVRAHGSGVGSRAQKFWRGRSRWRSWRWRPRVRPRAKARPLCILVDNESPNFKRKDRGRHTKAAVAELGESLQEGGRSGRGLRRSPRPRRHGAQPFPAPPRPASSGLSCRSAGGHHQARRSSSPA